MAGFNIILTSGAQGVPGQGVPTGGTTSQFLQKVDGTDFNTAWVTSTASVADINDITNVNITSVADGEVLQWDNTSSKWINVVSTASAAWGSITGTLSAQTDLQNALNLKAALSHTHLEADITDLQAYLLDITGEELADLSDVPALVANKLLKVNATADGLIWGDPAGTTVSWGDITGTLSNQTDLQTALNTKSSTGHTHVKVDITDADWISDITGESIKSLNDVFTTMTPTDGQVLTFDTTNGWQAETLPTDNDTTDHTLLSNIGTNTHAQIDTHIADATVHFTQATISITESQISDLGTYSAVGHTHVKANITDFSDGDYATAGQGTLADSSTQPGDNVSTLTNDAGYVSETSDTIQTTDATGTVLVTFAIASGEEKILDIKVHGHEDATNDHIWKRMTVGVKNVGGVASIVGGVDSAVGFDAGASAWSIVTSVSSGNVLVTVTGEAAKTIDWRSTLRSD